MIELSREFCAFLRKAEKPNCPAPWSEEAVAENRRAAIARELRVGFKAIMLSKKGK